MSNVLNYINEAFDKQIRDTNRSKKCEITESLSHNTNDLYDDIYNALSDIAFKYSTKGIAIYKKDFNDAIKYFMTRFFGYGPNDIDEAVIAPPKKDLSKIEGSITNTIETNISKFNDAKTKEELVDTLKEILDSNNIDTKASKRLLNTVQKAKGFAQALFAIYNSLLYGKGLGVIECVQGASSNKQTIKEDYNEEAIDIYEIDIPELMEYLHGEYTNGRLRPEAYVVGLRKAYDALESVDTQY